MAEVVLLCSEAVNRQAVHRRAVEVRIPFFAIGGHIHGTVLPAHLSIRIRICISTCPRHHSHTDVHAVCNPVLLKAKAKDGGTAVHPAKPLSIEFIADRLDTDDPFNCLQVRTMPEGHLQVRLPVISDPSSLLGSRQLNKVACVRVFVCLPCVCYGLIGVDYVDYLHGVAATLLLGLTVDSSRSRRGCCGRRGRGAQDGCGRDTRGCASKHNLRG